MGGAAGKILTGKTIAGKFRLGERLSEDPAGSTYLAVDIATGQNVMVLALSEGVRLEGEQEARALKHPNILAYRQSYFPNDALRFVTTDAPTGKSLAQVIAKRGPLHPGPSANLALQILSALHSIHSQKSFHGNLNPHSVFVGKSDKGELEVRILYPGAVRADAPTMAARYFAPEQILGEGVDRRADFWAVGAILYLCLFGRPAFDGADQEEISGKILLKDPVFPKETEALPAELVGAIRAALAKEPDKRPQFANNMIGDLLATAERFDEQMSALVAAALRNSIHPPPPVAKPSPVKPPPKKPAEAPFSATVMGVAQPVPHPAPTPAAVKQDAPRPAQAPTIVSHAVPVTPIATLAAGAQPAPLPAASIGGTPPASDDDARAAEAHEISAALESALEIDLLESVPPAPAAGGQRARLLLLAGRRKLVIAAACLAALIVAVVVIVLVTGGKDAALPAPATAPIAPPTPARQEAPTPEPVAPPQKVAAPELPNDAPAAAPDESPTPSLGKKSGGSAKPPRGKNPQPSQQKKKPAASKGAVGLASNPFGG